MSATLQNFYRESAAKLLVACFALNLVVAFAITTFVPTIICVHGHIAVVDDDHGHDDLSSQGSAALVAKDIHDAGLHGHLTEALLSSTQVAKTFSSAFLAASTPAFTTSERQPSHRSLQILHNAPKGSPPQA